MTQEALKFAKAITQPNTITFHNSNTDWVMRITADRRIEVNEDVEVSEAAQKVLDAMQYLLKAQRTWVDLTDEQIEKCYETTGHYQTLRPQDRLAVFALAKAIQAKLKQKNGYAEEKNT